MQRTMLRTWNKAELLAFLLCEKPVMGAKPGAVLWVCSWVVGKASKAHIAANRGQIPPVRVDNIKDFLLGGSLTLRGRCKDENLHCHRPI